MNKDLIFHIVSKRKWPELNHNGWYTPLDYDEENGVECVNSTLLNSFLNERYKGRKNLFLLVIDISRIANKYKKDAEKGTIYIERAINLDAILDKIRIDCSKEGTFNVEVRQE